MIGFYILGGLGLLILVALSIRDRSYKKGFDAGFEKGLRMNVEETYLQGAADAENFMIRADAEVLQERRRLWDEEIGA